ncbi:uncharacterized protein [Chironomus tepperi]|uniref:uncharacterized protein n=1 Tax=Chironomus tepperi TaxID=113505 RepID=UPI00391EE2DE
MSFKWKQCDVSDPPRKAVQGGTDVGGEPMFVGRAMHNGVMLPAKIIPANGSAYVCYDGVEVPVFDVEVLTGKAKHFNWVPASNGVVPTGAIPAGQDGDEQLFVGRAFHEGSLTVGKIHPSHGVLYIPFGGAEVSCPHYEALVSQKKSFFSAEKSSSDSD